MSNDNQQNHQWVQKYKWFWTCKTCGCLKLVPNLGETTYIPSGNGKSTTTEPICEPQNKQNERTK